jgi:hypothetical protein
LGIGTEPSVKYYISLQHRGCNIGVTCKKPKSRHGFPRSRLAGYLMLCLLGRTLRSRHVPWLAHQFSPSPLCFADPSKPPGTCSHLPASHLYEARLMIEPAYGLLGPSVSRGHIQVSCLALSSRLMTRD